MTINTQNSFLISSFLHLLFIAVFIAMPKPEYKVRQLIDISFLFSEIENEVQKQQTPIKKPLSKNEKLTAYPEMPARTEGRQAEKHPAIESRDNFTKAESLSSHKSEASATDLRGQSLSEKGTVPFETTVDKSVGSGSSYVQPGLNKGLESAASSHASKELASRIGGAGPAGADTDKSVIIQAFRERIESLKHYPYIARRKGIEGVVLILVHLDRAGELKEVVLRASSGYEILDMSAIELIKKACPFRHGYNSDLKIEIPITYKLMR